VSGDGFRYIFPAAIPGIAEFASTHSQPKRPRAPQLISAVISLSHLSACGKVGVENESTLIP
jgi:hypothetical protein